MEDDFWKLSQYLPDTWEDTSEEKEDYYLISGPFNVLKDTGIRKKNKRKGNIWGQLVATTHLRQIHKIKDGPPTNVPLSIFYLW